MKLKQKVNLRIDIENYKKLKRIALNRDMKATDLLNAIIEEYVKKNRRYY